MLMLIGKQRKENLGAFWMLCSAFSGGQVVVSKLPISIPLLEPSKETRNVQAGGLRGRH